MSCWVRARCGCDAPTGAGRHQDGLDFLKLEIDGIELEGLVGAAKFIQTHKPLMLIETIKTDVAKLKRVLEGFGYQYHQVGINLVAIHASDPCRSRINSG
jgi:hypothetical protein